MATPEAKVKAKVKKILVELNCYYAMPATGGYGNSGTPDFLVCLDGEFIGIECKAGQGKPTALQLKHQSDIVAAGGRSFVIYESNIESLKQELNKHGKF